MLAHLSFLWFYAILFARKQCMVSANQDHLQLIDGHGVFVPTNQIHQVLSRWNLGNVGTNYSIVSIEGPQSSGKSFLLNRMFGTDFRVMNPERREQTTQGVWMGSARGTMMIILDAEGSDSRERGVDDNASFEKKTLAFTLAHSNVIIINLWTMQVGLYRGAGLELLQTIFERHLKLFQTPKDAPKKVLLFVLRDDSHETPLRELTRVLRESLEYVWSGISTNGAGFNEYFMLEVASLPNPRSLPDAFTQGVQHIKSRFHDSPGGLLYHSVDQNIPITGLPDYMQLNHAAIDADEELNMPSHYQLVLERRLSTFAAEALALFEAEVSEVRMKLEANHVIEGLKQVLGDALNTGLNYFTASTKGYKVSSYESRLFELRMRMLEMLQRLYDRNVLNSARLHRNAFPGDAEGLMSLGNGDEFRAAASRLKDAKMNAFVSTQTGGALLTEWIESQTREDLGQDLNAALENAGRRWRELHPPPPPPRKPWWQEIIAPLVVGTVCAITGSPFCLLGA